VTWQQARDSPCLLRERAGTGADVQHGDGLTAEAGEQLADQQGGRRLSGPRGAAEDDNARYVRQWQSRPGLIALQLIGLTGTVTTGHDDHALVPTARPVFWRPLECSLD
jgi:hypothetical protein